MKIVVAGGTGFLGRHICDALIASGHSVTVLGRDPKKVARIPELAGARAVRGDVTDPDTLTDPLLGADAVVQAAQFPNHPVEVPRRRLTYFHYDFKGTANLLDASVRAGATHFLYVSGAGADAASDKTWYRAKGLAEDAIRASDVEHFILRPSWAYGPEDRALNRFAAIAKVSPVVPVPSPVGRSQRVQPIYVDDLARAIANAFSREGLWGATYEIGGREVLTMSEVVHTLLEVIGKRRLVVRVPAPLLKLATAPLAVLPKPPMSPLGIEFATQDGLVDTEPTIEALGIDPIPLAEGLRRYMRRPRS